MTSELEDRFGRLLVGYDKLEHLFKITQLALLDFKTSVLNEHRYFARALVDYCKATTDAEKVEALSRAEVALGSAYNDIVDFLVNNIKEVVIGLRAAHWNAKVNEILGTYEYKKVTKAIEKANSLISQSRRDRATRFKQYENLVGTPEFNKLVEFSLSLLTIEYECNVDKTGRSGVRKQIADLRKAFANSSNNDAQPKFELFFQPKFLCEPTPNGLVPQLIGAEALIRLRHPEAGLLGPLDFFNTAHRAHLSDALGDWVVHNAIQIAWRWKKSYRLPQAFDLSINITPDQMASETFAKDFASSVVSAGVDDLLSIELVEDWLHDENQHVDVSDRLGHLPEKTKVAIDDFGTGTTRIEYLAHIDNLHSIKVDKSLVDGILSKKKKKSVQLITGIVQLARSNSLEIIAEGVEKEEQVLALIELGVRKFQGYALGRPAPVHEFESQYLEQFARPRRA